MERMVLQSISFTRPISFVTSSQTVDSCIESGPLHFCALLKGLCLNPRLHNILGSCLHGLVQFHPELGLVARV